jgi:hypothetical protein
VEVPYLKPGERSGHDISLSVDLDAGVPIRDLQVLQHKGEIKNDGDRKATATLSGAKVIPNKDFVLRYAVVGEKPEMALLCHAKNGQGYFMLMIQPKEDEKLKQAPPREMVFLIDVSGSMSGGPNAKCREAMRLALGLCREKDTVQVITFAGQTKKLFEKAVPCSEENIKSALAFSDQSRGGGGTEMLKGVQAAIDDPLDADRVRIVVMLTDGYIGNEAQIIEYVGKKCGDRVRFWVLGIGSSVNRFLVDGVAKQGGGMGKVVGLNEDPTATVQEIIMRIQRAQLANVKVDWGGLRVSETYPAKLPELYAGRPLIVYGLYRDGGKATVTVSGNIEGEPAKWPLQVEWPAESASHEVLAKVWARQKIEDLMQQTYYQGSPEVAEAVTALALDYRLMSQYTSFVAVDEREVASGDESPRQPLRIAVPVPMPEGVSWTGVFGGEEDAEANGLVGVERLKKSESANGPSFAKLPRAQSPRLRRSVGGFGVRGARAVSAPTASTATAPMPVMKAVEAKEDYQYLAADEKDGGGRSAYLSLYLGQLLAQQTSQKTGALIPKLAQLATDLEKKGGLRAARAVMAFAYMAQSVGYAPDVQGPTLEKLDRELVKQMTEAEPRLAKKLNLVLQDVSLQDALAAVAKESMLPLELVEGSAEDVCALLHRGALRITYLDLRHASVAQALDWMLRPLALEWRTGGKGVLVSSARRSEVPSPWVYDLSLLVTPTEKELGEEKDQYKRAQKALDIITRFASKLNEALEIEKDMFFWLAPGQLAVFASPTAHTEAAKLFTSLADPAAELTRAMRKLEEPREALSARATANKENMAKAQAALEERRVLNALRTFAPRLLVEATAGRLDAEAMAELQVAWKSPALDGVMKKAGPDVVRALWQMQESAGLLSKEGKLAALVDDARKLAQPTSDEALKMREGLPRTPVTFLTVLYAALTEPATANARREARVLLQQWKGALPGSQMVADALLAPAGEIDATGLAQVVEKGTQSLRGDDLVLFTALACRRAGGETWNVFRTAQRDLLGEQPLSGYVIVLVNRLSQTPLPGLAK